MKQTGRQIVTLEWNAEDTAAVFASLMKPGEDAGKVMEMPRGRLGTMESDRIEKDGKLIGATSSRCYSIFFRQMLSLAVVESDHAKLGDEVTVIWGDRDGPKMPIRATLCNAPYKTDRRKLDLSKLEPSISK
ncbi:MAG: glycine cleavage T C-terminal barrel domain-containing protein [Sulfitobacter sp.]